MSPVGEIPSPIHPFVLTSKSNFIRPSSEFIDHDKL